MSNDLRPNISIIIPIYNEEKNVRELHKEILDVCQKLNKEFEIIFINDGSTDNTFCLLYTSPSPRD